MLLAVVHANNVIVVIIVRIVVNIIFVKNDMEKDDNHEMKVTNTQYQTDQSRNTTDNDSLQDLERNGEDVADEANDRDDKDDEHSVVKATNTEYANNNAKNGGDLASK